MSGQTYIVEVAVLLLVAFVIGGLAGFWLRRWLAPTGVAGAQQTPQTASEGEEAPVEAVVLAAASVPVAPDAVPADSTEDDKAKAETEPKASEPTKKPAKAAKTTTARKSASTKKTGNGAKAKSGAEKKPARKKPATSAEPTQEPGAPNLLASARDGRADDLKKIKGIGPKLETTLNGLGVFHYDQIAAWGAAEIAWVDDKLSFHGRIEREGWVEQAKALVSGS